MMKLKINSEKGGKLEIETFSLFSVILTFVLLGAGCQPNQTVLKDGAPSSPTPMATAEMQKTSFQQDLRDMQTANFDYIFVFRRKDGAAFDTEDRKFLRQNTPPETNRWTSSDDGKAFIAGSGFAFPPEQIAVLQSRFNVEDYSKPEIKANANQPVNAQTNAANKNSNMANTGKNSNKANK